jgi:hypothetical protein
MTDDAELKILAAMRDAFRLAHKQRQPDDAPLTDEEADAMALDYLKRTKDFPILIRAVLSPLRNPRRP